MHDVDGDQSARSEEASTARQTRRVGRIQNAVDTTVDKDMGSSAMRYETKPDC